MLEDGTYAIDLVSRDLLHRLDSPIQDSEIWLAEFLDSNGVVVARTSPSSDLEDGETANITTISDAVALDNVASVRPVHAGSSDANSVQPLALFVRPIGCSPQSFEIEFLSDEQKLFNYGPYEEPWSSQKQVKPRSGDYRIYLESGDDQHVKDNIADQANESWYLVGLDSDGGVIFETSPSADLPSEWVGNTTDVGVYSMTGVVAIQARHAAKNADPNSLFALSATFVPESSSGVGDGDAVLFEDEDLRIVYRQLGTDESSYTAEIEIQNRSDVAITDWHLLFETKDQLTDVGRAELVSQEQSQVLIGPDPSAPTIEAASSTSFSFTATYAQDGIADVPKSADLLRSGVMPGDDDDGDRIPDYIELKAGLDPDSNDSDGDGLFDDVEWQVRLDPTNPDTDDNGTLDGNEDLDSDGLTNIDEVGLGTALRNPDTDQDLLDDGEEVRLSTDPLVADTDGDGASDGAEVELGADPLVANQAFDITETMEDEGASPSVSIGGVAGDQVESLAIIPLPEDHQRLSSETPGYLGHGYEFSFAEEFDSADVSFTFDPVGQDPDFDPAIYTFDEETQLLLEVPNQVVAGNTVSATVTHFSEFILLDRSKQSKVWEYQFLNPPEGDPFERYDVVFAIDSSGSMLENDPANQRLTVVRDFVQQLSGRNRAGIVDFNGTAKTLSPLTTDKAALLTALDRIDSSGDTSLTVGMSASLDLLEAPDGMLGQRFKAVVLLTDGAGDYDLGLTSRAAENDIVVYAVGLGGDVDISLLTDITNQTNGQYFPVAEAGELDAVFSSITDLVDLYQDSDKDGISDYYEKEMRAGNLTVGTGEPLRKMDPFNADSDADGIIDGQEISIQRSLAPTADKVYARMTSDPQKGDSDGDGKPDPDDDLPLVFDPEEMLIHQSANREGRRKEPDLNNFQVPPSQLVADDLTFNDYTGGELRDLDDNFRLAPITPEVLMWARFNDIFTIGKLGASSDHKAAVDGLVDKFRNGNNGNEALPVTITDNYNPDLYNFYSSAELNNAVGSSSQMREYIDTARGIIIDSIVENGGSLDHLQVQDDLSKNFLYQEFLDFQIYPVWDFSVRDSNERALSIAIHQFHGHQISIKNYKHTEDGFSGVLVFHSYDHFGLDPDDGIAKYGFIDWFTLQHYDRFDGEYTPPLAVVDIEIPFDSRV